MILNSSVNTVNKKNKVGESYIINPEYLIGFDEIRKDYLLVIENMNSLENNKHKNMADKLASLLKYNAAEIGGTQDLFDKIIYVGMAKFHKEIKQEYKEYFGLDIVFNSMSSDKRIGSIAQQLGYSSISKKDDLHYTQSLTESGQQFLIQNMPFTPWLHVDITDPKIWYITGGIDTLPVEVSDDCGYAASSRIVLTWERNHEIDRVLQKTGHYHISNSEFYTSLNGQPFEPVARLEVFPLQKMHDVCMEIAAIVD